MEKEFTVWVGGTEVNDYYLTEVEAEALANEYLDDGYDDVIVENINEK
jgi:hypothetical protein